MINRRSFVATLCAPFIVPLGKLVPKEEPPAPVRPYYVTRVEMDDHGYELFFDRVLEHAQPRQKIPRSCIRINGAPQSDCYVPRVGDRWEILPPPAAGSPPDPLTSYKR